MNYKSEIVLLGADLDLGENIRDNCPHCGGGSTKEKSLSITRGEDGALIWQCFRASCNESGTTNNTGTLLTRRAVETRPKPKKLFTGRTEALSEDHLERIHSLWGITNPPYWYWTPEYGGRVAMSVRSPKYLHRGWVLRDIRGRSAVKALTYIESNEEGLSWYKTTPHAPTVLVEDMPSAVRASKYVNTVALLGTGIGLDRALEIGSNATRPIVVALDQDATSLSFRWARKYSLLWGDVIVLPLTKDLKNMTETELEEILHG